MLHAIDREIEANLLELKTVLGSRKQIDQFMEYMAGVCTIPLKDAHGNPSDLSIKISKKSIRLWKDATEITRVIKNAVYSRYDDLNGEIRREHGLLTDEQLKYTSKTTEEAVERLCQVRNKLQDIWWKIKGAYLYVEAGHAFQNGGPLYDRFTLTIELPPTKA